MVTPTDSQHARRRPPGAAGSRAPLIGLLVAVALIAAAIAVPLATGWDVASRAPRSADPRAVPPLHGVWVPHVGLATIVVSAVAVAAWVWAPGLAQRLRWPWLIAASCAASAVWLVALALVDGPTGLSRVLGNPFEYLQTARRIDDIGAFLGGFLERVPIDAPDNWVTHVAGHPPGMLLFFVALVRLGLGADLVAGLVVALIAATIPAGVLIALRALGAERAARPAAPFLVFTPAAVFLAVSADAVIATVGVWAVALVALAATAVRAGAAIAWSLAAGILFGILVMMSYGMPLYGVIALAVLLGARRWRPLPSVAAAAALVVVVFALGGFALWEAYPILVERYRAGIAASRPAEYWVWANIAALLISAGPFVAAGLGETVVRRRRDPDRTVILLVAAAMVAIALATASGMSKAEVERIWLPFIPWLTLSLSLLDGRWRRAALAGQLMWAILVQHLLYTVW
ncbi:hypothetical protein [Microbacterium hominis]|uniref:Integral membrane protein n=1 Tax=Microbacterium hominis TaxID=162426 RepID=A0A7D4Q0S5_9MICO|nr:hypothetical protein [Microbacterium hominis]QKJ19412.1 hypothetical protein HQM25_08545 [Microbacterium hominis]